MTIRILIVDDSLSARGAIRMMLAKEPGFEVVGEASDAFRAKNLVESLRPDVVTLDIEMPSMDGITYLERMRGPGGPRVVIVSSVSKRGGEVAMKALAAGASGIVSKPSPEYPPLVMRRDLLEAVRGAAASKVVSAALLATTKAANVLRPRRCDVVAIGASTGGPRAIEQIVRALRVNAPPTVIVQHMPAVFTEAFARRLDGVSRVEVREAKDGDVLRTGRVLVAPGGRQMRVESAASGVGWVVRVTEGEPVNGHAPSVDVLFESVARACGDRALGALLTGMGADGARGLVAMRDAGARTLAQDEETSAVYGMPRAAHALGAAMDVLPLERIAARIAAAA